MKKEFQTSKGNIYIRKLDKQFPDRQDIRREIEVLLREKLQVPDLRIENKSSGKPFIPGMETLEISISHTVDTIAVYVSPIQAVGIDIEHERNLILKAKPRFMNAAELALFPETSVHDLHLIWGAKEAIYKQFEGNFQALEEEVTVSGIDRAKSLVTTQSIFGETQCFYWVEAGFYVVWT